MTSVSKSLLSSFEDTYEKYVKYIGMQIIKDDKTPTEWKNRIWDCLMYFQKKYYTVHMVGKITFALTKLCRILLMGKNTPQNME